MADSDRDQTTTTTGSDLKDQARQAFGSIFSSANIIPLDKVKRLGVYRPEERPQLAAVFDRLTKFINAQYRLIDNQKIIIRLLDQGAVELTTEDQRQYSEVPEAERRTRLFMADLIQLASDIGKTLWSWEQSEQLREFGEVDEWYWLKELGEEAGTNQISNFFAKEKIAKLQRELFADIWHAFKVGEPEPTDEPAAAVPDASGATVPGEKLEAITAAYAASGKGGDSDAQTDTSETVTAKERTPAEELGIRERQIEQQTLLIKLQQELFENIVGDLTTKEIDQMWSDLEPGLIAEITDFFATHPELREKLAVASAGDSLVRSEIYQQFLLALHTNANLINRLTQMYTAASDRAVVVGPNRAVELEKSLKQAVDILGENQVSRIISHIEQTATIAQIPKTKPAPITTEASPLDQQVLLEPESKLQKSAFEYLTSHAEYEIFRKTRIFLHQLSPELDLSAQNIHTAIAEFARQETLSLTTTQLRLAQADPAYLRSLYERFASNLQRQYPEITNFLIDYGWFISQTSPAEAAQFEHIYRNGILGKTLSAKDALKTELQNTLKGAATAVVIENTITTIDAMILEFGDKAPEFVESISIDRLELAFGLASGTLTSETAPLFLTTLRGQMQLRLTELRMAGNPEFLAAGGFQGGVLPTTPKQTETVLAAVPLSRQLLTTTQSDTETTIAALGAPTKPVEKNHAAWWSSLPKDAQLQVYAKLMGSAAAGEYAAFSAVPFPDKLSALSNTEIRKMLVGIWSESPQLTPDQTAQFQTIDRELETLDRLVIAQVKTAELHKQVVAAIMQDIKDEQAAIIAAQLGLQVAEKASAQATIIAAVNSGQAPIPAQNLVTMNEALVQGGSNALVGADPYASNFAQQFAGRAGSLASSLRSAAMEKLKKKLAGNLLKGAATKAGLAATGVGLPAAAILTLLQNKTARKIVLGGGALLVAKTLYSLTTYGGALGAIAGGLIGGPIGALIGANVGAMIPGLGGQWTGLMGWTPHAPTSPFSTSGSTAGSLSSSGTSSLRALRSEGAANSSTAAHSVSSTGGESFSAANQTATAATPASGSTFVQGDPTAATTAAGSSSLTGLLGATTATVVATAAPLLGIGVGLFLSIQVLFIIYGAFLVDVPSEGLGGPTAELSKYATLTKKANPNTLPINIPSEVTYTVEFAPKSKYRLQITRVEDVFSYQGCDKTQANSCDLSLESPLELGSFPTESITSPAEVGYSVTINGSDVMVINSLTITFDVYDSAGTKLATNESITALESVVVGNPQVGCFVPGESGEAFITNFGTIYSMSWNDKNSASDFNKILSAYSNTVGANEQFTNLLCAKGPITLYRLDKNPNNYYGWAMGYSKIGFYADTFNNVVGTEYTLVHELGHIIDYRNAGLRASFTTLLPKNLYACFDYPGSTCSDGEAFPEAIARYATNYKNYNLKQKHPKVHTWLKNNIFGGIEY